GKGHGKGFCCFIQLLRLNLEAEEVFILVIAVRAPLLTVFTEDDRPPIFTRYRQQSVGSGIHLSAGNGYRRIKRNAWNAVSTGTPHLAVRCQIRKYRSAIGIRTTVRKRYGTDAQALDHCLGTAGRW